MGPLGTSFTQAPRSDCGSAPAVQNNQESLRSLALWDQPELAKWKKRPSTANLPTGPKEAHSTVLSIEEEAAIAAPGFVSYFAHAGAVFLVS